MKIKAARAMFLKAVAMTRGAINDPARLRKTFSGWGAQGDEEEKGLRKQWYLAQLSAANMTRKLDASAALAEYEEVRYHGPRGSTSPAGCRCLPDAACRMLPAGEAARCLAAAESRLFAALALAQLLLILKSHRVLGGGEAPPSEWAPLERAAEKYAREAKEMVEQDGLDFLRDHALRHRERGLSTSEGAVPGAQEGATPGGRARMSSRSRMSSVSLGERSLSVSGREEAGPEPQLVKPFRLQVSPTRPSRAPLDDDDDDDNGDDDDDDGDDSVPHGPLSCPPERPRGAPP